MEQQLHSEVSKLRLVNGGHSTISHTPHPEVKAEGVIAKLPSVLQTTLELNELVTLFHKQIETALSFDSFHYRHAAIGCEIDTAPRCHHSCHYKLEMNGVYLGDVTLTRRKVFNSAEINLVEDLLCTLVYPLRNALMYKEAITSALKDSLTGLNNRAAFDSSLKREIELATRQLTPLSVVVLDIDHFKVVNDSYGHSSGDKALKQLADTITTTLRSSDIAFRYGGEEFTLILSNTDEADAKRVANRLRVAVSQLSCEDEKHTFGFSISLGVAQFQEGENAYSLFDRADKALYQAKRAGRNAVVCA